MIRDHVSMEPVRGAEESPQIFVEGFWLAYPMGFLKWPTRVAPLYPMGIELINDEARQREALRKLEEGHYVVPWADRALDLPLFDPILQGEPVPLWVVRDHAKRPVISIYRRLAEQGQTTGDVRPDSPEGARTRPWPEFS